MRLLVLSFYYRPDLCAGSFRATPLVEALRSLAPHDAQIDVLTTWPNRYRSYAADTHELEARAGLEIRRIRLPAHRSDMLGQSRAFLSYARQVLRHTRTRRYDLVFATSSRLMTAALAAQVARRQGARLYLDIRDIFVDTLQDVLPAPAALAARGLFGALERRSFARADRINLVSEGFRSYFAGRYPQRTFSWFTNGIDEEFIAAARDIDPHRPAATPARIVYAGNIGAGQGLAGILPALATRLRGRAVFRVIGDGGRASELRRALEVAAVDNVELLPPVDRARLIAEYRNADVLFLHLNALQAFERVLPSKIFEYAAMGKPILAGVAGFPARFISEEIDNAAVFAPGDAAAAERALASLTLADHRREQFLARFARAELTARLAADVMALARAA